MVSHSTGPCTEGRRGITVWWPTVQRLGGALYGVRPLFGAPLYWWGRGHCVEPLYREGSGITQCNLCTEGEQGPVQGGGIVWSDLYMGEGGQGPLQVGDSINGAPCTKRGSLCGAHCSEGGGSCIWGSHCMESPRVEPPCTVPHCTEGVSQYRAPLYGDPPPPFPPWTDTCVNINSPHPAECGR